MDWFDKTNEELIRELEELSLKYNQLKSSYEEDISVRNKTEEKLLLSEEKLRKAFATNPDAMTINRFSDGKFVSINEGFSKITGYSEEEIKGKTSIELNIWTTSQRGNVIKGLKAAGIVQNLEGNFRRKDGSFRTGMMSAAIIDLDSVPHILSITRDITDRKLAEEKLRKSEEKFRKAFITSPDSININRLSDGMYISINNGFTKITGYTEDEVIGKTSIELNIWADPADRKKLVKELREKGEVQNLETDFLMKNGSVKNGMMSASIIDLDGVPHILSVTRDITEKNYAEIALRESENKYRELIELAVDGILLNSSDGTIISANSYILNLTDCSLDQLLGMNIDELFDSSNLEDNPIRFDLLQKGETIISERNILRRDGSKVPVEMHSKMMPDGTFQSIYHDISDRKLADEALKESRQLFETLAQTSPVGIFRTKSDGSTTYVNPKWLELSGLSSEQAVGYGWLRAVHPDDREKLEGRWNSDVQSQISSFAEYRFLRSDGSIVWVLGNAVPEWIGDRVAGYIGTITDITERKQAELALRKSEEKYRSIFENVQDVYFETSIDGEILEISPSISSLSKGQYQMDDLIGKSIFDFYAKPGVRRTLLKKLQEKGSVTDFEITLINRDESRTPCSISAVLIYEINGQPEKIIGNIHDITDRKNVSDALRLAKEKAETSDKLKTEFLNNISHEVRTPLNGILGFAEIISRQDLSDTEKKESLAMLFESSNRLLNTITNYMDISLITSGSLSVNKKVFIPAMILKKILNNFESVCIGKRLKLFLEIPENSHDYYINSDPEICQKILSHFLDNAVKFTEKGSIHFGFNCKDEQLEFFVRDTGIGINLESFNIIFDRFVKESPGPYKVSEGSGLGLSIAQGMSEAIGGKIRLESEPGAGSCFFLSVPITKFAEASSPRTPGKEQRKIIPGSLILIAEDDETNFYYLNALVTRETGAKVLHASNGREAIELFKANPNIKLILMDMKMPEIDGFEATQQIKLIEPNVTIIAITAHAMSGDEDRIIAAGCDGYLSKPINKKSLLEKMAEFVSIR